MMNNHTLRNTSLLPFCDNLLNRCKSDTQSIQPYTLTPCQYLHPTADNIMTLFIFRGNFLNLHLPLWHFRSVHMRFLIAVLLRFKLKVQIGLVLANRVVDTELWVRYFTTWFYCRSPCVVWRSFTVGLLKQPGPG